MGRLLTLLRAYPREAAFTETPLWKQKIWLAPFISPTWQHKHKGTCGMQSNTNTGNLTTLHKAPAPYALAGQASQLKIASVPAPWVPPPEEQQNPVSTHLMTI